MGCESADIRFEDGEIKHIIQEDYLRNNIRWRDIESVIDIGTGHSGVFDYGRFQSLDLSYKACLDVYYIRPDIDKSWQKIIASATHLPLKDDSFDHVQSTEMIEHIDPLNHRTVLRELKRIARKCVFLTATGLVSHLGEGQMRCEIENPFQKYREIVSTELLENEGFEILDFIKEKITNEKRLRTWKKHAKGLEPIREHVKAFYDHEE